MTPQDPNGAGPATGSLSSAPTSRFALEPLPPDLVWRRDASFSDLVRRIARRRWLLSSIAVIVFGLVATWAFVATPRYKSEARLRIESDNSTPGLSDQVSALPGASLLGFTKDELETEVGVLRSDRIADAMIDSLALGVRLVSPVVNRASILDARVVDPVSDVDGKVTLIRGAGGRYRPENRTIDDATTLPATILPGSPVRVGGTVITLSPRLLTGGPSSIKLRFLPRYKVHALLERRLVIERQEGGSRLVEVSFEDPDRVLAAQVVGRIISEYVAYSNATQHYEDTTQIDELQNQVTRTRDMLTRSESALRTFQERSGLIAPEEQATAQVKRVSAISAQVDAISVERNALQRMLAIVDERSRGGGGPASYRQLATFPSLITNRAIQDVLQALLDLENKRSQLGVRRTENNDEYRQLTNRIGELEGELHQVGSQYLESLDQQLATTAAAVTALTDTLERMPAAATQYGRLVRDRTVLEATYVALQKQLKAAELKQVLRQEKVRIVDSPRVANHDDPAFPKKPVMLMLGAVLGIVIALTVGLALELWHEPQLP